MIQMHSIAKNNIQMYNYKDAWVGKYQARTLDERQ